MNAVPAIVSGKRIVMTVPAVNGKVNNLVLGCAKLLGIKNIQNWWRSSNWSSCIWNKKN